MDRTGEFVKIVCSTHIPQKQVPPLASPYLRVFEVDVSVGKVLHELEAALGKERIYESFTLQSKIDRARELIGKMREAVDLDVGSRNEQEKTSYANLNGMIRNRVSRHLLRLAELVRRKESRAQVAEERRQRFDSGPQEGAGQDVVLMENEVETERTRERQRITMQISEIGQIMEEISAHVSLQEESFRRIDELMGTSDSLIAESLELVRKTWENVSNTRPAIIKFLLFWVVLALVFWALRR